MSRVRATIAAAAAGVALSACALLPGRSGAPDPEEELVSREITLEVDNQNFHDATLYAVRGGERRRIGNVGGLRTGEFAFVWTDLDLRVEIYLLSVGSYYTSPLMIEPGDELKLTVLPNLHRLRPGSVF
ncbi:MAG: hypothetical protein HY337_01410 [Gemmatimonadetes bacterium]|nr:hypothetical protein [Gemmatimonadota bacterium]